jgi:Fe-S cluster assembly protein SufD
MHDIVDTIDLKELLLNKHSSLLEKQNGRNSPALKKRKESAWSVFAKEGFPTTKNEEWKYTNLSNALKKDFSLQTDDVIDKTDIEQLLLPDLQANVFIFINGKYVKELSIFLDKEAVLEVKGYADISSEILEDHYEKSLSEKDPFSSLNLAFAENGMFVKIPAGKAPLYPIVFYYITDKRNKSIFSQPRLVLWAEENSKAKVVEYHVCLGAKESFANAYTQLILGLEAHVDYYKIQREGEESYHVGTTQVVHQAKSFFSATTITLDGTIVRNNINIKLNADHSECFLYGLYLAEGKNHIDNHTLVDHAKPNCYSNELYKGVLSGRATGVFNGKIMVREDAQKTNAFQSNKNILLSDDATMNTKPQLEIFADDVKCSHGATVGQLNEEPLFYLRSRGLSEKKAKALLTLAFADDIIEHIKIPALKEYMRSLIAEQLSKE